MFRDTDFPMDEHNYMGENSPMTKTRGMLATIKPTFWIIVIIPTMLSAIYFGLLASDVYISESNFVVKSPERERSVGGFASFFSGQSSSGSDDIHAVEEYINSRDALRDLNSNQLVLTAYSRDQISVFNRFGALGEEGEEELYRYFKKRVSATYDSSKTVTKLRVEAYTAQDAFAINKRLLELGEKLVNKLNQRSRTDLVNYAENEVVEAKARAAESAVALSRYRNQRGVVDPERQATVQVQLISKLQDELIANQTQLDQLRQFAPDNPQVSVLRERVSSIQRQMNSETGKVAGNVGSLAGAAAGYEKVQQENEFASKQLASAMASLEDARNEARRQQVYIERIVQPNLPDAASEPKRLKGVAATLFLGLILYAIVTLAMSAIREHKQ